MQGEGGGGVINPKKGKFVTKNLFKVMLNEGVFKSYEK